MESFFELIDGREVDRFNVTAGWVFAWLDLGFRRGFSG